MVVVVCVCVCVCVCVFVCLFVCVCSCVCVHVLVCSVASVNRLYCVVVNVCVCVVLCVCMYVFVHVCVSLGVNRTSYVWIHENSAQDGCVRCCGPVECVNDCNGTQVELDHTWLQISCAGCRGNQSLRTRPGRELVLFYACSMVTRNCIVVHRTRNRSRSIGRKAEDASILWTSTASVCGEARGGRRVCQAQLVVQLLQVASLRCSRGIFLMPVSPITTARIGASGNQAVLKRDGPVVATSEESCEYLVFVCPALLLISKIRGSLKCPKTAVGS